MSFTFAKPQGTPGAPAPASPPRPAVNPVMRALTEAKASNSGTVWPRISALYLLEVDAIKCTGTQGIRYGCIEAKVVESKAMSAGDTAIAAGTSVSLLENLTQIDKGGPGRFVAALHAVAGEDWGALPADNKFARMSQFVADDQNPVNPFHDLGVGCRFVVETSPGESKGKTGPKRDITVKKYSAYPKTEEEAKRIDARRVAAGLKSLAEVWNTGLQA